METNVELLKKMVRESGTITGFNYAYCKVLYLEAIKLLQTDFTDGHGTVYVVTEENIPRLQELSKQYIAYMDASDLCTEPGDYQKQQEEIKPFDIGWKKKSLMLPIKEILANQTKIVDGSVSLGSDAGAIKTLEFLSLVKAYLALFEE